MWLFDEKPTMATYLTIATSVAGFLVGIWNFLSWMHTAITKWNAFAIDFVDHPPPHERVLAFWDIYPLQIANESFHWMKITFNRGLNLSSFSIRFAPTGEASSHSTPDPISSDIIYLRDLFAPPEIMLHGSSYVQTNIPLGGKGGIQGTFTPPHVIAKGTQLFFKIRICTKRPWSGMLRFDGIDQENICRTACAPVRVISNHDVG